MEHASWLPLASKGLGFLVLGWFGYVCNVGFGHGKLKGYATHDLTLTNFFSLDDTTFVFCRMGFFLIWNGWMDNFHGSCNGQIASCLLYLISGALRTD